MKKGQLSNLLRQFGLIYFTDWLRFYIQRFTNWKINKKFKQNNPNVKLPSDYLLYESFQINYQKYYTESIETAQWLADHLKKHIDLKDKTILDWGCGPGRIIRHLPVVIGNGCTFYGTDYNAKSIEWCAANLPDVKFNKNTLQAQLPYVDNSIDIIYGISIFTHLSEQMHYDWYNELFRILRPNGIMFLTTQGDNFRVKLVDNEIANFDNGNLVVRGKVKEGHRTYSAFHPKQFMLNLFSNVDVLEHIEERSMGGYIPQDIWIIRKK